MRKNIEYIVFVLFSVKYRTENCFIYVFTQHRNYFGIGVVMQACNACLSLQDGGRLGGMYQKFKAV